MQINEALTSEIESVIAQRFEHMDVQKVTIESIEVIEDRLELRIVVLIETTADSETLADSYFGLTRRVKSALGETWRDFFPVITPIIGNEAHA